MANKDSNITTMDKNKETIKKVSAKVHEELLNTSHMFIDETVATLTRMQKITGKVIKKSEPIIEKQIEMTFDTVEAIADQTRKGGKRALKLLGITKQYNKLTNTISKKVKEIPSAEEMIDNAKEMVANAKSDVEETINKASDSLKAAAKFSEKTTPAKSKVESAPKKVKATSKKSTTAAKKAPATDLTKINGIGPALAAIMTANGVKTIKDLTEATPTALKVIATKAGNRYKSFDTNKWVESAKAFNK